MTALATASDLHASNSSSSYGVGAHSWMLRCTEFKKDQSRPSKTRRYRSSSGSSLKAALQTIMVMTVVAIMMMRMMLRNCEDG